MPLLGCRPDRITVIPTRGGRSPERQSQRATALAGGRYAGVSGHKGHSSALVVHCPHREPIQSQASICAAPPWELTARGATLAQHTDGCYLLDTWGYLAADATHIWTTLTTGCTRRLNQRYRAQLARPTSKICASQLHRFAHCHNRASFTHPVRIRNSKLSSTRQSTVV